MVPVYNEYDSLPALVEAIAGVLNHLGQPYEIIGVDDGSTDGSSDRLRELSHQYPQLRAVILRRNYGQTAAMAAGFDHARGQIVITMDGDLQNDPADIPRLLERLNEGYDLVSGWRKERQDNTLTRLIPSKIANWLIGNVTGVELHDYGCSLKAYRAEVIHDLNLYGELHRFLPALAFIEGARITEMPVNHHPRRFGASKYGLGRTLRVVMDAHRLLYEKVSHSPHARLRQPGAVFDGGRGCPGHLLDPSENFGRPRYRRSPPAGARRRAAAGGHSAV